MGQLDIKSNLTAQSWKVVEAGLVIVQSVLILKLLFFKYSCYFCQHLCVKCLTELLVPV